MFNSKYLNQRTIVDGYRFASIKEGHRYKELKILEKAKEIKDLQIQPEFILQIAFTDNQGKKHQPIKYVGDFQYYDNKLKQIVVEDVKGFVTQTYKVKKKMFLYSFPQYYFLET